MKTLIAALAVLACLSAAAHAQAPASARQLVRQADFVGTVQAGPSASSSQGEWRQNIFLSHAEVIKGTLARDFGNNQYPYIEADHAGVSGYPTRFGEAGEYLVFLHKTGTGPSARWTTLAAYRVQYRPYSLGGLPGLEADSVIGLLTPGTAPSSSALQPVVTGTEARRWLGRLALGQPLPARDEAKMNAFFHASLLSAEASKSRATPTHEERLAVAQELAEAVPIGMTRAQVEKIFPQSDGGIVSSDQGRYYFGSEIMVNVPFDTSGGPFQPENRVKGPLRVYRDTMHYD